MKLDELLAKQARGEELTEAEIDFIKKSVLEESSEKETKVENKAEGSLEETIKALQAQLEQTKQELELKKTEVSSFKSEQQIKDELITEQKKQLQALSESLGKTETEQKEIKAKLEAEKEKEKQLQATKEIVDTLKKQYSSETEELKKTLQALQVENEYSKVKGNIMENMSSKPYFKSYYTKMLNILSETEDKKKAIEQVKTLEKTISTLFDEEEEKKKYETNKSKSNKSIFEDLNTDPDKKPKNTKVDGDDLLKTFLKDSHWLR